MLYSSAVLIEVISGLDNGCRKNRSYVCLVGMISGRMRGHDVPFS